MRRAVARLRKTTERGREQANMENEKAKKLADDALNALANALDAGQSDALKTYLATMAKFHHYSWGNVLLIATQKPNATHVAGYRAWQKLNRHVRKGEKGIVILAPMVVRKKEDGEETEDVQTRVFGFRTAHVFDISQTEGTALPEFATVKGDTRDYTLQLKTAIRDNRITLEYTSDIYPALGCSTGGRIQIQPFLPAAAEFSVLVHEYAHELLHKGQRRHDTTRKVRETEAEAVSFVVCCAIGLDTNTAASDYIQLYDGTKETLAESLQFVQQTATTIITQLTAVTAEELVA